MSCGVSEHLPTLIVHDCPFLFLHPCDDAEIPFSKHSSNVKCGVVTSMKSRSGHDGLLFLIHRCPSPRRHLVVTWVSQSVSVFWQRFWYRARGIQFISVYGTKKYVLPYLIISYYRHDLKAIRQICLFNSLTDTHCRAFASACRGHRKQTKLC